MSRNMVLIEYTEDRDANAGLAGEDDKAFTIEKGTQRDGDPRSARSLVTIKKVAKFVGDAEEKAEARAAVKAEPKPAAPEPSANGAV